MDFLSDYKLSEKQKIWLKAIWSYLLEKGELPNYTTIRRQTLTKTGPEFNPNDIPKELAKEHATEITLLGVLQIDTSGRILEVANKILKYIRQKVIDDAEKVDFTLYEIADGLASDEIYIRIVFKLLSEYGRFWNSAGTKLDDNKYGYDLFSIKDPDIFDNYMRFESFEKELEKYFLKTKDWRKQDTQIVKNHKFQNSEIFVDPSRIDQLKSLDQKKYDLSKLIRICEELNTNYSFNNYFSVAYLSRALIDHIPPIFKFGAFRELANNYKSERNERSFKKAMIHLNNSLRNISDINLHSQIRRSESLPNKTQIDFKNDLDILLGEIVRILKVI